MLGAENPPPPSPDFVPASSLRADNLHGPFCFPYKTKNQPSRKTQNDLTVVVTQSVLWSSTVSLRSVVVATI